MTDSLPSKPFKILLIGDSGSLSEVHMLIM